MPELFDGRLPFITPVDMWAVTETGNWSEDNRTGARYAKALVDVLRDDKTRVPMLGHIFRDMLGHGKFGPIEVGFCHYLSATLANSRTEP